MLFYVPDSDAYISYKPHYVYNPVAPRSQPQPLFYSHYDPATSLRAAAEEEVMRKLAAEQERRRREAIVAETRRRAQAEARLRALAQTQAQAQAHPRSCACSHSRSGQPQSVFGDFSLFGLPFVVSRYPADKEEEGEKSEGYDKKVQHEESFGGEYAGHACPRCHYRAGPQMKGGQRPAMPTAHSSSQRETEVASLKPQTQGPKSRMGKSVVKESVSNGNQASGAPTVWFTFPVTSPVDAPAKPVASPESRMKVTTENIVPTSNASSFAPIQIEQTKEQSEEQTVSDADTDTADESEINPIQRAAALSDISALTARFTALREAFVMPFVLDFEDRNSEQTVHPVLAYNKNTSPVHAYMHDLMELLQSADAIESNGDRSVREARRAVVRSVEAELERVDSEITKVWESTRVRPAGQPEENMEMATEPELTEAVVDDVPVPPSEVETEPVQMDVEPEPSHSTTTEVVTEQDSTSTLNSDRVVTDVEIKELKPETETPTEIAEAKSATTVDAIPIDAPTPATIASENEINIQLMEEERNVDSNGDVAMTLEPTTASELDMEVDREIDNLHSSLSLPLLGSEGGSASVGVRNSKLATQEISSPISPLRPFVSLPQSSEPSSRSSTPISAPLELVELEAYELESILPRKRSRIDDEEERESLSGGYNDVRVEDVRREMEQEEEDEVLIERALSPSSNAHSSDISTSNVTLPVTHLYPDDSAASLASSPNPDVQNQTSAPTLTSVQQHVLTATGDEIHASQDVVVEDAPIQSNGFLAQLSSSIMTSTPSVQLPRETVGEGDGFVLV